ncbi:hypothetical protein BDA99DRAFT_561372 [Phascolomyces articulosus]|uniref:Uncharacterized protein n=1 Tax=Phascolomyces articulosus TaxID=60185 RepID=A0AAD5KAU3_9FUNG|nr:hypothetical protein BDA99DRAFT_561372 [Phascolomyces articulosus]
MAPGTKECCPYTDRQCSKMRNPEVDCSFTMFYSRNGEHSKYSHTTNCPCGGLIIVNGSFERFSYQVYAADRTQIGGYNP